MKIKKPKNSTLKKTVKSKVAAKIGKSKNKIAQKCGVLAALALFFTQIAVFMTGCMGTTTPSRSQTMTIHDCTIKIYGGVGAIQTNDIARVEFGSQAMAIETSGTETQTTTPTQTTDVKPDIDLRYNDAIAGASAASKGVLETLMASSANKVLSLMQSKESGTVNVTKTDGTTAIVKCENGQCEFCEDCETTSK